MSQNKTVIQGLEPADTNIGGFNSNEKSNFYSRGSRPVARGTVVPGMMESQTSTVDNSREITLQRKNKVSQSGKPIVGFLYSVSRTPTGEFWPILMGRNTIGQNPESDIQLAEGTISSNHAVIVTRQVKNGVIAAITDAQSTNGTMINGETIGFSAEECHDGDIITVGNNYELLLILVDAAKKGLTVSKNFIQIAEEEELDEEDEFPVFSSVATRPGGFDPYNGAESPSWGTGTDYQSSKGTVGLDGSTSGANHGGTIPM